MLLGVSTCGVKERQEGRSGGRGLVLATKSTIPDVVHSEGVRIRLTYCNAGLMALGASRTPHVTIISYYPYNYIRVTPGTGI